MSRRTYLRMALASTLCATSTAHALVISDDVFTKNGGNLANIPGTIAVAMEPQRTLSYASQFLSVGDISGCSATWIGDTPDNKWSYILTAAHCVEGTSATAPTNRTFTDWAGRVAASGLGEYVLNPYRLNRPSGFGGASTDIALLRLPKTATIVDGSGIAVPPPVLYDGSAELNQTVWFAGYGSWGTGTGDSNGGYFPVSGARRAAGTSTIGSIFENDHGIGASFSPQIGGKFSARVAPGDSGSAWWQQNDGYWTIIATTNGGSSKLSTGARVSQYADWVRSVYPQARFLSDQYTVTESRNVVTPNLALEASQGTVAYVVPQQAGTTGPTTIVWKGDAGPAFIETTMQEQSSKRSVPVKLRAMRDIGCGPDYYEPMNAAVSCYENRSGPLIVSFQASDNPGIAPGTYSTSFQVEARGWHDSAYSRTLTLRANITVK